MKNTGSGKIAERYVNALFDVALDAGIVDTIEKDLTALAGLIRENADFRAFLTNPLLTREAQGAIAANVMKSIGVNQLTAQFIALLAHQKRLDILPEMIALFIKQAQTGRGEISAELIAAKAVSAKESGAISQALSKAYDKKVNLSVREDPALLGGTIIKIGSLQLDSSIAGKLNRLKTALHA